MSYSLGTTSCGADSDDDDDVRCEEVDPMETLFGDAGDKDSDADSSPGANPGAAPTTVGSAARLAIGCRRTGRSCCSSGQSCALSSLAPVPAAHAVANTACGGT